MGKLHLVLLIHAHQPVGNFDDVFEQAYARSYRPFVELLLRHPSAHVGLHYSGPLLEWIEQAHPDFFAQLRTLVERSQVELVGGGFYEPILITIPPEDRLEQICRLSDYLEKHFGKRPRGAWLAERVWEASLTSSLAAAGIECTLVDDNHFICAGYELNQLHGYYLAKDLGSTVKVIPGLKALRYLIPYQSVDEVLNFLRGIAAQSPGGMATMGDDCEKFGVWPGTYDHCYRHGWLEKFFAAVEANQDWLTTSTPGDYVSTHEPLGRAELPNASYTEMMEWALPTAARQRFHALQQEFSSRPDVLAFLRGSGWRNFLAKYPEANLLHQKMLYTSEKIHRLAKSRRRGQAFQRYLAEATDDLLRAQCNDAYWHGIFGGLYAPHLRTALWRSLVRAESLADALEHRSKKYSEVKQCDFDAEGHEEVYVTSESYAVLFDPADGGTIAEIDFRPPGVTLINSIQRRREPYHARLQNLPGGGAKGVVSIHDQARVKEEGLERWLRYDRWPRHCFRLLLFGTGKTYEDYQQLRLDEDGALAGGAYAVLETSASNVKLASPEPAGNNGRGWLVEKDFSLNRSADGFEIGCDFTLSYSKPEAVRANVGMELVINFLAPAQPDRYFESVDGRYPLRWAAATPASELRLVDEWQKVAVTIAGPDARQFWIAPIETVSESEEGFERVYQGSQILTIWPVELAPGASWKAQLVLKVSLLT